MLNFDISKVAYLSSLHQVLPSAEERVATVKLSNCKFTRTEYQTKIQVNHINRALRSRIKTTRQESLALT